MPFLKVMSLPVVSCQQDEPIKYIRSRNNFLGIYRLAFTVNSRLHLCESCRFIGIEYPFVGSRQVLCIPKRTVQWFEVCANWSLKNPPSIAPARPHPSSSRKLNSCSLKRSLILGTIAALQVRSMSSLRRFVYDYLQVCEVQSDKLIVIVPTFRLNLLLSSGQYFECVLQGSLQY